MAVSKFSEPIPERRRTRFAPNGGPRPTARQRRAAQRGLTAAREALAATTPDAPARRIVEPMTPAQRERAQSCIEAVREALSA